MTRPFPRVLHVSQALLDRQLLDRDGVPAGKVDDIEFADPVPGEDAPALVALLSGPTALGPRIGGRIGKWWTALARRFHVVGSPEPSRIPVWAVDGLAPAGIRLRIRRDQLKSHQFADWARHKVVNRIPGSGS